MKKPTHAKAGLHHPFEDGNKLDLRSEIQDAYGQQSQPWTAWVLDGLALGPHDRVLELGCGTGRMWQQNPDRMQPGWQLVLSDLTPALVRQARSSLTGGQGALRFACLNSQALPFAAGSFDAVLAVGVLDLVADLDRALDEARRVLRPGGLFAATAGGRGHLRELEERLKAFIPTRAAETVGGEETRFGLENGQRLLEGYFSNVARRDYQDEMRMNAVQPVLDYALSEPDVLQSLSVARLGGLVHALKRELAERGAIDITIRKGLFTARR